MQYHRGLLHQRGHGCGALLRVGAKAVAKAVAKHTIPAAVQAVGGLMENKQQTGEGFFGRKISCTLKRRKLATQSGRGVKRVNRVKRRKKQKGKGFITDLLKTGAKQALRAAAQTGLDVLDNKRSLKDAIKTHGIRAIKSTAQPLLARGGPWKPKKRSMKRPMKRPPIKRSQTKKPIKRPLQKAPIKKPPIKIPAKRPKRTLDILDTC
jgi:hypothetical protein